MADVLGRGAIGDDDAIKRELALLFDQIDKRLPHLTYVDAPGSIAFAGYLESVANRLLDMSEAISERYLERAATSHPAWPQGAPDQPEHQDEIL